MDRTDLNLSRLLLVNSRRPYRELAEELNLSVPAVHTRIQAMQEAGVIEAFTARISLAYLAAPTAIVFGVSDASDPAEVSKRLGKEEHTYWTSIAGGNFLYVGGYLRDLSELEGYAAFVAKEAGMPSATVGLMPAPPLPSGAEDRYALDHLDYRILNALHKDARRALTEVAEEVGASAKTTARHLERMTREGAVDFSVNWYPDASDDILSVFHLRLKRGEDKPSAMALLYNRYGPDLLFVFPYSNLPNLLFAAFWTNSMKGLKDLRERVGKEAPFESVMTNVLYTGRIFDTWRDALLREKAASKGPAT